MWKVFIAGGAILVVAWVTYFSMDVSTLSRYMIVITYYDTQWSVCPVGEEVRDCHGVSSRWGTTTTHRMLEQLSCNGGPDPDPVCYIGGTPVPCVVEPVSEYCYCDGQGLVCSR